MAYKPKKIKITPEMVRKARERDKGKYNDKSFMDGAGNFVGFLGEYMFQSYRPDYEMVNSFDFDFKGKAGTIDVKTKGTTVSDAPRSDYMASVCRDSEHQNVDFYIFCRVFKNKDGEYTHGWILGGMSKEEFMSKATFYKKGEKEGDNGYEVKQDCWSLPYGELKSMRENT